MSELSLASSHSMQVSLQEIRIGEAGLNAHRQAMLDRVPEIGDWAAFGHETLELKDLAYLTAKVGHEFALLRGKREDILFHGDRGECHFVGTLEVMLLNHQLEIIGHSHPGEEDPEPSPADRAVLRKINQKKSIVISGMTGRMNDFTEDPFEL